MPIDATSRVRSKSEAITPERLARRALLLGAPALSLMMRFGSAKAEEDTHYFRIGTAAATGTYFQIGGVLANLISKPPGTNECERGGSCGVEGLVAVAEATQGSLENVAAVDAARLESALAQADIAYWAATGTGLFKGKPPLDKLRAIASLFPECAHVVVSADSAIHAVRDLKGKRVGLGERESGTIVDARLILDAAGITERDLKPDYRALSLAAQALQSGELDAFFLFGGYPVPAIAQLAAGTPIRLLPVDGDSADRLLAKNAFFTRATIPANVYHGIDTETQTISSDALWIVNADVPDELVYAITAALWRDANRRLLDQGHPMGERIRLANAMDGLAVRLHPGALRYYQEIGLKNIPNQ
ncbi:MAG TPA: TAXI family TRAP transporter solute-binding subunit [Stellaceae bacterium]|nr:TAXI family TRAP transporter solute-binding subunit [Stellaceae bacterium]